MSNSQHWKIKLVYIGVGSLFGCLCTIIGMLASPATAQRDKFGDIECTSLRVVDADGKTRVILSTDNLAGYDDENIRVFIDGDAYDGNVRVYGKGGSKFGSAGATLGIIETRIENTDPLKSERRQAGYVGAYGGKRTGSVELGINEHGGTVDVRGKDTITTGVFIGMNQKENGGVVSVYGMGDSKSEARLGISENGGGVDVFGKDGQLASFLHVDEDGAGVVRANSKNGKASALLNINEQGGACYVSGKDEKSSVFLSIGEQGGACYVSGRDGKSSVLLSIGKQGGACFISGKDGKSTALLDVSEHGGRVELGGKGEGGAAIGINEYGNGAVSTWDKNGYRQ